MKYNKQLIPNLIIEVMDDATKPFAETAKIPLDQLARRITEVLHIQQYQGQIWYFDDEKEEWTIDEDNKLINKLQWTWLYQKHAWIKELYYKIVSLAEEAEVEFEPTPIIYLNGYKIFIDDDKDSVTYGKWKQEKIDKTIFNPYQITIKNITNYEEQKENVDRLIDILFPNNKDWALANFAQCFMKFNFEKLIYLYGQGNDGKSTIINLLQNICTDKTAAIEINDNSQFARANFANKLFVFEADHDVSKPLNTKELKEKTTNGYIKIEQKFKNAITIYNYATLVVSCNAEPIFNDSSDATIRRINQITFENSMLRNPNLNWFDKADIVKLINDPNFKIAFIIECLLAFEKLYDPRKGDIVMPKEIADYHKTLEIENNQIYRFIDDNLEYVEKLNNSEKLELTEIYKQYRFNWCNNENITKGIYNNKNFYKTFRNIIINKYKIPLDEEKKKNQGKMYYYIFKHNIERGC